VISLWEAIQGLWFMGILGLLTRGSIRRTRPAKKDREMADLNEI
jgi:hypothetical protein